MIVELIIPEADKGKVQSGVKPFNSNIFKSVMSKKSESSSLLDDTPFLNEWGFTLKDLYNLSLVFFKEKQGKAVHFNYEERLKLVALTSQVSQGKFDPQTSPPLGVLDVIGKDRREAWQALGDKTKGDCMFEFISILNKQCPLFKPFVEAHKRDLEEKEKIRVEASKNEDSYKDAQEHLRKEEEERERQEEQKRRIQDALNIQTFAQFKDYAQQQYPGNPEQQGVLIRQLQEQHYDQYMRQIYQQNLCSGQSSNSSPQNSKGEETPVKIKDDENPSTNTSLEPDSPTKEIKEDVHEHEDSMDKNDENQIAAASMWTRKDVKDFKESVRAEGGEAIIKIGQGESVTVRVPTHEDGTCLFWEFATDSYDVGFGLFFEWTEEDEPVSITVVDENSSEEEEEDETLASLRQDIEKGRELLPKGAKPNTSVIIPVYRRDAHLDVYVGSHLFPGKGVYLLKFDNSYSFWRSKTLYYRVYYTK